MTEPATVHASAVRAGDVGILIRGPSGAGKSRLAFDLILAGRAGQIPETMLVGDDRVLLFAAGDEKLGVRPAPELEGLIEIHGLGVRRCEFVPQVTLGLVVDLAAADSARMPERASLAIAIQGIKVPRIPVGTGSDPLPLVLAALLTSPL